MVMDGSSLQATRKASLSRTAVNQPHISFLTPMFLWIWWRNSRIDPVLTWKVHVHVHVHEEYIRTNSMDEGVPMNWDHEEEGSVCQNLN